MIKERGASVSEISGEPLRGDARVHHKNRVADKPEEAFDDDNLTVIKDQEHTEYHSSKYIQDKIGFEEYVAAKNNKKIDVDNQLLSPRVNEHGIVKLCIYYEV